MDTKKLPDDILLLKKLLIEKKSTLKIKDNELKTKDNELTIKDNELTIKDNELKTKDNELTIKDNELKIKDNEIFKRDQLIINLNDALALLRRKKFAPSSETTKQIPLFNELEELLSNDIEEENEDEEDVKKPSKKRGKRKPIPSHFPRVDVIIEPDEKEQYDKDGIELECIGEEVSERIEITPQKIKVIRTIRKKYKTPENKIISADVPDQLLPKSIATPSLIAQIITAKYVDALPLYRQEEIFKRVQLDLNRNTMARWLIKVSKKMIPIYNLLQDQLLAKSYIHMDETTVQVLNEEGKKATSKSYMWVRYAPGDHPIILFDYAPSRAGSVPLELLEGFMGTLQVDGYDGYAPAIAKFNLRRLGCMDHCRRKFVDASKSSNGKNIGKKGVKLLDKLYKIERKIKELNPKEKQKIREKEAIPLLEEIKKWIDDLRPKITPKSLAGKAINYAYNEWNYLSGYVEDPNYNISNILVENAIRPFALGRKNWMFSASVDGANASAMFYSLIETAKANGIEPFFYLNKMLEKLSAATTVDDFEKLLPLKENFQS